MKFVFKKKIPVEYFRVAFIIITFFISLPQCSKTTSPKQLNAGSTPPNFTLPTLNGETVTLSSLRGKVVLLNFWASWCPPCMEEMPSLQSLYAKFTSKDFVLLAVNIEEDGKVLASQIVKKLGLKFTILLDPSQKTTKLYHLTGVPETYLLDKNGVIAEKFIGPRNWEEPPFLEKIEELLK